MPVDYRWALMCMLALLGGSIYLMQRIVSLMFGWGWLAVLAGAYFVSPFVGRLDDIGATKYELATKLVAERRR